MTKDIIYKDDAGNCLIKDIDNRLVILNKNNEMIGTEDGKKFINRISVRMAMKRYFGDVPRIKILNAKQTHHIKNKISGGLY
jgi:hypothetical protein